MKHLCLVGLAALAGCLPRNDIPTENIPATTTAIERFRKIAGVVPCFTADLTLRIQSPQQAGESVNVSVKHRADGFYRIDLSRLDVIGASLVVKPDHTWILWLPRDQLVDTGQSLPPLTVQHPHPVAILAWLVHELRDGAVPTGTISADHGDIRITDPIATVTSVINHLDHDQYPSGKRLEDAGGNLLADLSYERWQVGEGWVRLNRGLITLPDQTTITFRIKLFRPVPAIGSRMQLDVPDNAARFDANTLNGLFVENPEPKP